MEKMDDIVMSFPGGRKVAVRMGNHEIITDQPVSSGGDDAGLSPYSLFLASIGGCAGFYALAFFQKRGLSTEGLRVTANVRSGEGGLEGVDVSVVVPDDFPEKYRGALLRSIEGCSVKRAIQAQPDIRVGIQESVAQTPAPNGAEASP